MNQDEPSEMTQAFQAAMDGWSKVMELRLVSVTDSEVVAELVVGPQHLQPYGIVHGGVHAGIVETTASVGAAAWAIPKGLSVVGLDNHTSFVRAVRSGTLRAVAKPLTRGRRSQLWQSDITDETGRLVATGKVRLMCLDPSVPLAGERPEPHPAE